VIEVGQVGLSRPKEKTHKQWTMKTIVFTVIQHSLRFRLRVQVFKCQHNMAPAWIPGRALPTCLQHRPTPASIRSARRGQLDVPRVRLSTFRNIHSVMLDRLLGITLFLSVSRTIHCLCLTLVTSSNISTSHLTSTPSAFDVVYS